MAHWLLHDAQVDLPREMGESDSARDTGGWGGWFLFFHLLVVFLGSVHQAASARQRFCCYSVVAASGWRLGRRLQGLRGRRTESLRPSAVYFLLQMRLLVFRDLVAGKLAAALNSSPSPAAPLVGPYLDGDYHTEVSRRPLD
ncbi:hypothetical protein GUJ93_ZPchr0010g8469 [Zizania palustris]|uniref:Uncharacterized protein n=1 Tax=Zizania palustris TaxID=103762 RepID=A0A8J6BGV5_ZIZPA|nr:hypothetical protein GUJ93_ZPchr0010g8469 [Zizania palustris]